MNCTTLYTLRGCVMIPINRFSLGILFTVDRLQWVNDERRNYIGNTNELLIQAAKDHLSNMYQSHCGLISANVARTIIINAIF